MSIQSTHNMGLADRLLRGLAGSALLVNGLRHIGKSPLRKMEAAVGGVFLAYGIAGFDPLLCVLGATTIPGKENSVWNLMKQALPGQGILPSRTQDVLPRKRRKPFPEAVPLNVALSIG